jgi:hypothetical protein
MNNSEVWSTINLFKLPRSTCAADRSKGAPLCVPQMYVFVVLFCFGDTSACVPCCLFVYGKYLPFAPLLISLIYPPPHSSPGLLSTYPLPFDFVCLLFVFFEFLNSNKLFPIIQSFIFL